MESGDIGEIGATLVTASLEANGYRCRQNTQLPGSTDIEAVGRTSGKKMLVQVKTALHPNTASSLSTNEKSNITARADRLSATAWLAQVQINNQGKLIGKIRWTKLN